MLLLNKFKLWLLIKDYKLLKFNKCYLFLLLIILTLNFLGNYSNGKKDYLLTLNRMLKIVRSYGIMILWVILAKHLLLKNIVKYLLLILLCLNLLKSAICYIWLNHTMIPYLLIFLDPIMKLDISMVFLNHLRTNCLLLLNTNVFRLNLRKFLSLLYLLILFLIMINFASFSNYSRWSTTPV